VTTSAVIFDLFDTLVLLDRERLPEVQVNGKTRRTTAGHLHQRASALQEALSEERDRIRASGGAMVDQHDWKAKAERLDGYAIEVNQVLKEIQELGGVTKDIETGLVDFPGLVAQAGPKPVNLRGRLGGDAGRFLDRFNEGFAQRKPLL